ncbi:MAG: hypothetical protein ACREGH_03765, partial [Minisyncoccia bacterium]
GHQRVKIAVDGTSLLLSVRGNMSHQEIWIYTTDPEKARRHIFRKAHDAGMEVQFRENQR